MECPACNHLNTATSVRCVVCGTILIKEVVGFSPEFEGTVNRMDRRVYSGIGGFFGFFLTAVFLKFIFEHLWLSDREVYSYSLFGGAAGSLLGLAFLRFKQGRL